MRKPVKGFITYSHEDTKQKDELRKRLAVMEQNEELVTWHDGQLPPGDGALPEDLLKKVADSDLLFYLVSAASLASTNCNKELAEAIGRDKRVVPIILEHCDWLRHQLSGFEVLPHKGKPINDINEWNPESKGWQNVVDGIRKVVEDKIEDSQNVVDGIREEAPSKYMSESAPNKTFAEWAFQQGNFSLMLEQTDSAIEAYSQAIDLNPDFAEAYNNRGNVYRATGDLVAAFADYNKAIDLDSEYAIAYNNRGVAYRNTGDLVAAFADYNKAIDLATEDAGVYYNRGEAWLHLKEWEKAKVDLTTAKDMGFDIIAFFQNDYESVEDFEAKNGVKIPEDIAALLQRTNPSSRKAKYKSYMQLLIDRLREEYRFTRARVGQPLNWYSFSSGIKGVSYRVKFARENKVWTYVNIHDDVRAKRFDLFDALEQRKEEIESAFGSPLVWERLEKQRRSRIVISRDGNIELPDDELEGIREWHIVNLLKLKKVFEPKIREEIEKLLG